MGKALLRLLEYNKLKIIFVANEDERAGWQRIGFRKRKIDD